MSDRYYKHILKAEIDCANCAREVEEGLGKLDSVKAVSFNYAKKTLTAETTLNKKELIEKAKEIEDEIEFPELNIRKYRIKAEIDCANCAREVEEALENADDVYSAHFDFPRKEISVETSLTLDEIKAICVKAEEDIEFLDEEYKTYKLKADIDCANCAQEVEEALSKNAAVRSCTFNFPKKEITITTALSKDEVKKLAKEAEDEIIFLDDEMYKYTIGAEIDCAECARKVEEALNKNAAVRSCSFNFPKKEIKIETSLTLDEIKAIAKGAEEDIVFLDEKKKEEKDYTLPRIIAAAIVFAIAMVSGYKQIAIISYIVAGYDVLWRAIKNIAKGKVFDENFLMAIATVGALFIASYDEAAGVMIFYQIGEYFQNKATRKSQKNIALLMDLKADTAEVEEDGVFKSVKSEEVKIGDKIRVKAGEKVPVDSIVISGESFLDTKALTGESVPRKAIKGDKVLSGSINGEGTLILEAKALYKDSTASKILRLVDEGEAKKSKSEKFISKFSRYYTPSICIAAALIAIISPFVLGVSIKDSLYRACMLLVISCPCALVLSVPLTYFASMGSFAKHGVLVKCDETIQNIAKLSLLALDKTGTITEGVFSVQEMLLSDDNYMLIRKAASLEKNSSHPIAKAIVEFAKDNYEEATDVKEIPGIGLEGIVNGHKIKAGSKKILNKAIKEPEAIGTHVYVTEDDKLIGIIVISDKIKKNSIEAIKELKKDGIKEIWMLSGDRSEIAEKVADEAGLDGAYGELLPEDKITALEKLLAKGYVTGYAGDGINDAPVLKRADIGFAMGGVGSDAAIEAADAVIMNDDLMRIPTAIKIAKKTERIVRENIAFSLIVKALVFILAACGIANMWLAVFADTGVALIAVVNAMRALRWKDR